MTRWWGLIRSVVIYLNPIRLLPWKRFYKTLLTPGDIAFDVGAHVGSRARAMHAAGAKVIALEPQAPFTGFLRWSLPKDIVVIDAAVGKTEAQADMSVSSKHPTVSSLRTDFVSAAQDAKGFDRVEWDSVQRVSVVSLDSLIAKYGQPNYLKIDVEGYELEVLEGLTNPVALISVEYLPGFMDLTNKVLDRLKELGNYEFNVVIAERATFAWEDWQSDEHLRSWLNQLPEKARSGDLFARLHTEI